jgi:chaperone required for assembly of F1-ATPase
VELAAARMKKFYKEVAVEAAPGGWRVRLDARPIRTQGGTGQVVPGRALAEALAGEWRAQGERIDPRSFPLRDLADYALDHVAPARDTAIAKLLGYVETDTLCYRAEPDVSLFQRQQAEWEPLVRACEAAHGIRLERTSGIVHRPQPPATLAALRAELEALDDFTLGALTTLASLAASLVVALAVLDQTADPAALFAAANLEQDWQAERWGWDAEAESARGAKLAAFEQAAHFLRLIQQG